MKFYISQSEADNHAVREAACACIAELGSKINQECVRPHVPLLLDALKVCFEDDSWPVRDGMLLMFIDRTVEVMKMETCNSRKTKRV